MKDVDFFDTYAPVVKWTTVRLLLVLTAQLALATKHCLTTFHVTIWEDNMGALTLANLDPGQSTPRSKFYDSKVHWFRSHLNSSMQVRKVDTKEQLGDLFTKPLVRDVFQCLRGQLMGW